MDYLKNEIEVKINKVGENFNLTIAGDAHVGLSTWGRGDTCPHYVDVTFYSVGIMQVLAQFAEALLRYTEGEI